jgi:hypothetical protein
MKCEICGKTPFMGATLFRQNEKGVVGIWRCEEHNRKFDDTQLHQIVAEIQVQCQKEQQ